MIMPLAESEGQAHAGAVGTRGFQTPIWSRTRSIWLPETACNEDTLEVLVEEKISLSFFPVSGAGGPVDGREWKDVTGAY